MAQLVALVMWIAGIILASGFWSTFFAVVFPGWAWYLVIEHGLRALGWI